MERKGAEERETGAANPPPQAEAIPCCSVASVTSLSSDTRNSAGAANPLPQARNDSVLFRDMPLKGLKEGYRSCGSCVRAALLRTGS